MQIAERLVPLRDAVASLRADGPLALVPTMGALHLGHMALVEAARERADHVVASIDLRPFDPADMAKAIAGSAYAR